MTQPMSKSEAVEVLEAYENGWRPQLSPDTERLAKARAIALSALRQGEGEKFYVVPGEEIQGASVEEVVHHALEYHYVKEGESLEIEEWTATGKFAVIADYDAEFAHPPAQAATQGEGEAVFSTMADDNGPAIADRHSQPERPQGGDAWDCPLCGQRNSGWSNECGRCEMKRLATPQPAHAVGEAQISTAPAIRAASKFLIDRFGKARCDSEAVSCCVRCNAVALARMSVELLTPPLPVERKEGERG
jgi:hypothetical protein